MDDIVTRLRKAVCWCNEFDGVCPACDGADEIERLRVENDRLRVRIFGLLTKLGQQAMRHGI